MVVLRLIFALTVISSCSIVPVTIQRARSSIQIECTDYRAEINDILQSESGIDTFVLMHKQRIIHEYGPSHIPMNTHSIRKSVLSLLYGIAIDQKQIDINTSLKSINFQDKKANLTDTERQATLKQLLQSRSGIYIAATGETDRMKRNRPKRHQYAPGEHYYYNNWDFNTLGYIYEQITGKSIGLALDKELAVPLRMESFKPEHVIYRDSKFSSSPQYVIFLSARDLAKIGSLVLQNGVWDNKQIVSSNWINQSTRKYSDAKSGPLDGFGLSWWIDTETNSIWASGWRGQYMLIDMEHELVLTCLNDTGRSYLDYLFRAILGFSGKGTYDDIQRIHSILIEAKKNGCI